GDGLSEAPPGRIRLEAPAARARSRIPSRYAEVEPDGEEACIVTTRGAWSRGFLVWMATLDEPMEVLDPPELIEVARTVAARLAPNPIG
ncbi:MAG: WYL domain-containing protein, partial [Solirubrobacteraceae bacterium]